MKEPCHPDLSATLASLEAFQPWQLTLRRARKSAGNSGRKDSVSEEPADDNISSSKLAPVQMVLYFGIDDGDESDDDKAEACC